MKKLLLSLLMALALSAGALAMEVPTSTVIQNLNGSQQLIKTYTLSPDADPQTLIEAPFELEGYVYTFADIVKTENHAADTDRHTETVTLETSSSELSDILEQLAPTMEYDDGVYTGTLALDHTSLRTEASGYTTKSRTVSATRTIGPVDRNDMSYVPSTTVKDGVTLSLTGVDWQITGMDVVGESLAPSSYQAVASYSGKTYYKAATGYVTTAQYVGEISRDELESITYQVTYIGEKGSLTEGSQETPPVDDTGDAGAGDAGETPDAPNTAKQTFLAAVPVLSRILGGVAVLAVIVLTVLLVSSRREVRRLQEPDEDSEDDEEMEDSQK